MIPEEPSPDHPVAFGRYELMRRIGAGGMGEVFLARERGTKTPRACVVKKVLPNLVANEHFVKRFLDEARVVVRLHHPNIASVYDMGQVDGEYFLSMEYVQGKTVSRFMRRLRERKEQLPLGVIMLIGERVCAGLQYAHEARDDRGDSLALVHRDLSPANVCISYRGEAKIIDFGAAQSTLKESQTAPRVVIGNLTYMAPEQAKKIHVDGRADVYALGVLLWELLAWKPLPQKGDPVERWKKAANPSWDAPSTLNPAVPEDVDRIILTAVDKSRDARYPNAAAFGAALRQARLRHWPTVTEDDIGALLSRAFKVERAEEDAAIAEVLDRHTVVRELTKNVRLRPPTALAFEHTAIVAPAELFAAMDEHANDDNDDDGDGDATQAEAEPPGPEHTPTPHQRPKGPSSRSLPKVAPPLNPRRTSFGVTFLDVTEPGISDQLLAEIDGSDDDAPSSEAFLLGRSFRFWVVGLFFFLLALGLGFFAMWTWLPKAQ